jgi:hypothetical protein
MLHFTTSNGVTAGRQQQHVSKDYGGSMMVQPEMQSLYNVVCLPQLLTGRVCQPAAEDTTDRARPTELLFNRPATASQPANNLVINAAWSSS